MEEAKNFILKGNIIYCPEKNAVRYAPDSFLVCRQGICEGVFPEIPAEYKSFPLEDFGQCLIIPGMADLHVHAPQYSFRGTKMDLELLDWLNLNTFPEEARYADVSYASHAYSLFVHDLASGFTTRACIFATLHPEATLELMRQLEDSGLCTMVGLVNMDRNAPDDLRQKDVPAAVSQTRAWLEQALSSFTRTRPIITPRFVPSCTDGLMEELGALRGEYNLPVQSHLSENRSEVAWVHELNPRAASYGGAYDMFGLFGGGYNAVMAHCVYCSEEEVALMKQNGVYVAHCPESNINLSSGIAPLRTYLDADLNIGLGSDVAGGASLSMLCAVRYTVQASKLYWRLVDDSARPVSCAEAFYLATMGGGSFFGKTGTFLPGYEFDAVIADDSIIPCAHEVPLEERLERMMYLADERAVIRKYVRGIPVSAACHSFVDKSRW